MNRMSQVTLSMITGALAMLVPALSHADTYLSLKLEPGVAVPLSAPQSNRFDTGGAFAIKGLVNPVPWLGVGPSLAVVVLPSTVQGVDTGAAWAYGVTAVVRRPHNNDSSTLLGANSFWVDGDLQAVQTGSLTRASASVALGLAFPTDHSRGLWVGPFVRYQNIFPSTSNPTIDARNANVGIVGISFEIEPKQPEHQAGLADRDHDGVPDVYDHCPDVPGPKSNDGCPWPVVHANPPPPPPVSHTTDTFSVKDALSRKVQFDFDSYALRPDAVESLTKIVGPLLSHTNYNVRIDGHASSEGTVAHNNVLSVNRAKAVRNWLIGHGVAANRLSVVGFGSANPVATNSTETGREANRRVEFDGVLTITISQDGK